MPENNPDPLPQPDDDPDWYVESHLEDEPVEVTPYTPEQKAWLRKCILEEADLGPFFDRCAEAGAKHRQALEAHAFACLFGQTAAESAAGRGSISL